MSFGSTFQYCGVAHGTWRKNWMTASGSSWRSIFGTR